MAVSSPVTPGVGLSTMLQLTPSQCRASVRCWWKLVCAFSYIPTAQTSLRATAVTLRSSLIAVDESLGFGLGTSLQLEPSQCSANVDSRAPKPLFEPTA